MIGKQKLENIAILEKSINHLQAQGFENINADMPGYETPKTFLKKGAGSNMVPDISAVKNGIKHYFDISLKLDKPSILKSKWLLLDTYSRLNAAVFKIITTKGHFKFTDQLLEDINLTNKEPLKI